MYENLKKLYHIVHDTEAEIREAIKNNQKLLESRNTDKGILFVEQDGLYQFYEYVTGEEYSEDN